MTDDESGVDGPVVPSTGADERPLGPAELADIARRQLGRGIPNDRPFLFLDLRDDGLRIVTIDSNDGLALDDHLVTTIRPSVLDHQLSDHLVRTGRVDQPTTEAWAKELLELAGRGRARLATLDGTFIMGRDHVKFFRVARRDLDVATASTAAIAVQYALEAAAASPETVSSIILGPRHQIWPGFAAVLTQTAGLPVIAIEPVAHGVTQSAPDPVRERAAEPAIRASVVRANSGGPAITRAAAVSPSVTRSAGAPAPEPEQAPVATPEPPAATTTRSSRNGPETVETDFVSRMAHSLRADPGTAAPADEPDDAADEADEHDDALIDEDGAEDAWADDSWSAGSGSETSRIPTGADGDAVVRARGDADRLDADVVKTEVVRTEVMKADVVHTEVLNASVINAGYINTDPTLINGAGAARHAPDRTSPPTRSTAPEAFVPAPLSSFGSGQSGTTGSWGTSPVTSAANRSAGGAIVKRQPHLEWKKWRPGRRGLIGIALAAAVALIITATVFAVGGGDDEKTTTRAAATSSAPAVVPAQPQPTSTPEYADPVENAQARKPALRYTPPPPPPPATTQEPQQSDGGNYRRAPRPRAKPRPRTIPNPIPGLPPIRLP